MNIKNKYFSELGLSCICMIIGKHVALDVAQPLLESNSNTMFDSLPNFGIGMFGILTGLMLAKIITATYEDVVEKKLKEKSTLKM